MKKAFESAEFVVIELNSDIVTASCPNNVGPVCFGTDDECLNDTGFVPFD